MDVLKIKDKVTKSKICFQQRLNRITREYSDLLVEAIEREGIESRGFISKGMPQSELFMAEIIPLIHELYMDLASFETKTVLDVGPQSFAGTALLQSIHDQYSYCHLKMKVSAIDIHDKLLNLKEIIAPKVEFIKGDIYSVNQTWDCIICSHVIEHVEDPKKFVERLIELSNDYVIIACPWEEKEPLSPNHINVIDQQFINSVKGQGLRIYSNYMWGKQRKVCMFWVNSRKQVR